MRNWQLDQTKFRTLVKLLVNFASFGMVRATSVMGSGGLPCGARLRHTISSRMLLSARFNEYQITVIVNVSFITRLVKCAICLYGMYLVTFHLALLVEDLRHRILIYRFIPLQETTDQVCRGAPSTRQLSLVFGPGMGAAGWTKSRCQPADVSKRKTQRHNHLLETNRTKGREKPEPPPERFRLGLPPLLLRLQHEHDTRN